MYDKAEEYLVVVSEKGQREPDQRTGRNPSQSGQGSHVLYIVSLQECLSTHTSMHQLNRGAIIIHHIRYQQGFHI